MTEETRPTWIVTVRHSRTAELKVKVPEKITESLKWKSSILGGGSGGKSFMKYLARKIRRTF